MEYGKLQNSLVPVENGFDKGHFLKTLFHFDQILDQAAPERIQKLLRLVIKNVKWGKDGMNEIDFYIPLLETKKPASIGHADWFDMNVQSGGPDRIRTGDLLRDRQACWASTPRDQ